METEPKKRGHIFVCSGGKISTLATDAIDLKSIGDVKIKRASHVDGSADLSRHALTWLIKNRPELAQLSKEPQLVQVDGELCFDNVTSLTRFREWLDPGVWWADLLPSGGPVLGPFERHDEAITAEVAWLREHKFHVTD